MTIRLEVFDDTVWADRVAHRWALAMQRNRAARLCLPTGETPRPVYAFAASVIDLDAATVFILDEFDLPPGNPARCDEMIRRDLLDLLTRWDEPALTALLERLEVECC